MSVLVCGLGASGMAACRLLRAEGAEVYAWDGRAEADAPEAAAFVKALQIPIFRQTADVPPGILWEYAVMSPGIPMDSPLAAGLRARGIPMISEVEAGWMRFHGKTLAVTGSNGKSSVVKALVDVLQAAGKQAVACGNYGLPVCQAVQEHPQADWLVVEVSSFQLETTHGFRPDIGILLNILPNHLDRHHTLEEYARLKFHLFSAQQAGDVALLPEGNVLRDFMCAKVGGGAVIPFDGDALPLPLGDSYFSAPPLRPAAAAIFAAAALAGVSAETTAHALQHFQPLPHRSQVAGREGTVVYVDDSKATNLAALQASVQMQEGRAVFLLAGGRLKEADLSAPAEALQGRLAGAYLYGEAAAAMAGAWHTAWPCRIFATLREAAEAARTDALQAAPAGSVVLLAPGCTSYDQFASYHARGEFFQRWVQEKIEL